MLVRVQLAQLKDLTGKQKALAVYNRFERGELCFPVDFTPFKETSNRPKAVACSVASPFVTRYSVNKTGEIPRLAMVATQGPIHLTGLNYRIIVGG